MEKWNFNQHRNNSSKIFRAIQWGKDPHIKEVSQESGASQWFGTLLKTVTITSGGHGLHSLLLGSRLEVYSFLLVHPMKSRKPQEYHSSSALYS